MKLGSDYESVIIIFQDRIYTSINCRIFVKFMEQILICLRINRYFVDFFSLFYDCNFITVLFCFIISSISSCYI